MAMMRPIAVALLLLCAAVDVFAQTPIIVTDGFEPVIGGYATIVVTVSAQSTRCVVSCDGVLGLITSLDQDYAPAPAPQGRATLNGTTARVPVPLTVSDYMYICYATEIIGGVSFTDESMTVIVRTKPFPPSIYIPADRGFVPLSGNPLRGELTLTVHRLATRAVVSCSDNANQSTIPVTNADADFDGVDASKSGTTATIRLALAANVALYKCKATQTVAGLTSGFSSDAYITTIPRPDPPTFNLSSAFALLYGSPLRVDVSLSVSASSTRAVVVCTDLDGLGPSISNVDMDYDGMSAILLGTRATIALALTAGKYYSCTAKQRVLGVDSLASQGTSITTVPPPPKVNTAGFLLMSGDPLRGVISLQVHPASSRTVVVCTDIASGLRVLSVDADYDGTLSVLTISGEIARADVKIALLGNSRYQCTATQMVRGAVSLPSLPSSLNTVAPEPTIETKGFVVLEGGFVTLTLTVHLNSTRAVVTCTSSDSNTLVSSSDTDYDGILSSKFGRTASVKIALMGNSLYQCTATQTVGGGISLPSLPSSLNTVAPEPTIQTKGFVVLEGGFATVTLAVHLNSTRAVVTCTSSDSNTLVSSSDTDYDGILSSKFGLTASVKLTLEEKKDYTCKAIQMVNNSFSTPSEEVMLSTKHETNTQRRFHWISCKGCNMRSRGI